MWQNLDFLTLLENINSMQHLDINANISNFIFFVLKIWISYFKKMGIYYKSEVLTKMSNFL